jgi:hypothetical protein
MYQLASGIYGLMHFNAWGNVMAPMMGMALAKAMRLIGQILYLFQ